MFLRSSQINLFSCCLLEEFCYSTFHFSLELWIQLLPGHSFQIFCHSWSVETFTPSSIYCFHSCIHCAHQLQLYAGSVVHGHVNLMSSQQICFHFIWPMICCRYLSSFKSFSLVTFNLLILCHLNNHCFSWTLYSKDYFILCSSDIQLLVLNKKHISASSARYAQFTIYIWFFIHEIPFVTFMASPHGGTLGLLFAAVRQWHQTPPPFADDS